MLSAFSQNLTKIEITKTPFIVITSQFIMVQQNHYNMEGQKVLINYNNKQAKE